MNDSRLKSGLLLIAFLLSPPAAYAAGDIEKELLGCWQRVEKPDEMMRFEKTRFINVGKTYQQIMPVIYEGRRVFTNINGQKEEFELTLQDGMLTVKNEVVEKYKRLNHIPPELDFSPLPLGQPKPVSAAKVKAIQDELARRAAEDQAVRTDPAKQENMAAVDAENTKYLRELAQELGWIDAKRFGRDASTHAFLIVQHSGDLRLMQAALPEIEKDLKTGIGDPQNYALLHDRLKLKLGERQRYGTQIGVNENGESVVLPLEDKSKVEQFRKAIGLFPLAQYLAIYKQQSGKEVKFAD